MERMPLSKEQLREARLNKLCSSEPSTISNISTCEFNTSDAGVSIRERDVTEVEFLEIHWLIFGNQKMGTGAANEQDIFRWFNQGFQFCSSLHDDKTGCSFGLRQGKGGPCGILAAVQAEIIKDIFFPNEITYHFDAKNLSIHQLDSLLVRAVARILQRTSSDRIQLVAPENLSCVIEGIFSHSKIKIFSCSTVDEAIRILEQRLLIHLKSSVGCMLFLMSLILTRQIYFLPHLFSLSFAEL